MNLLRESEGKGKDKAIISLFPGARRVKKNENKRGEHFENSCGLDSVQDSDQPKMLKKQDNRVPLAEPHTLWIFITSSWS